jgi:snRNA-activating protein complex subunit 1
LGDKIDEVVKEWDVQKEGFYERTGLSSSPGDQLMAVDNDESGARAQCHEDGSCGDQLMAVDNDESGVQDHEDLDDDDDGFAELELLLE